MSEKTDIFKELGLPDPPDDIMKAMYEAEQKAHTELNKQHRALQEKARNLEIQLERAKKPMPERMLELEKRVDDLTRAIARNSRLTSRLVPMA